MKSRTILSSLLLMQVCMATSGIAQSTTDSVRATVHHSTDFEVDGQGKASNWSTTDWVNLPRRSGPGTAYQTRAKILYSDAGIYCLYDCEDKKITATLQEDFADLYNEDVVELFLRSDENHPIYFEYELSPLNFELPIMVPNFKGDFFGWRPWHYEGKRRTRHAAYIRKAADTVRGWSAEVFIPFALLRPMVNSTPKKGDRWKANFYRLDYDAGQATWQWSPVRKESFHDYERFGTLVFD